MRAFSSLMFSAALTVPLALSSALPALAEGTITVTGEFSAVDGATVSIDVTLDEAVQVLAVPVAAVLRSADGDEVRIVNDAGTITRIKVTIGLIDGEWVEIKDGLKGDELVVVDIASGNVASAA